MKIYTLETIMAAKPCLGYTPERIQSLCPGRDSITALELCDLKKVSVEDRIWVLLSCGGDHVIPAVERIVRRAVETHALQCGVTTVEEWARKWLDGTDRSETAAQAARADTSWAATEASRAEAMRAAWAAANSAALAAGASYAAAAWAAAMAAAMAAALAAALAAAPNEAWARVLCVSREERDRQLQDIRNVIAGQIHSAAQQTGAGGYKR